MQLSRREVSKTSPNRPSFKQSVGAITLSFLMTFLPAPAKTDPATAAFFVSTALNFLQKDVGSPLMDLTLANRDLLKEMSVDIHNIQIGISEILAKVSAIEEKVILAALESKRISEGLEIRASFEIHGYELQKILKVLDQSSPKQKEIELNRYRSYLNSSYSESTLRLNTYEKFEGSLGIGSINTAIGSIHLLALAVERYERFGGSPIGVTDDAKRIKKSLAKILDAGRSGSLEQMIFLTHNDLLKTSIPLGIRQLNVANIGDSSMMNVSYEESDCIIKVKHVSRFADRGNYASAVSWRAPSVAVSKERYIGHYPIFSFNFTMSDWEPISAAHDAPCYALPWNVPHIKRFYPKNSKKVRWAKNFPAGIIGGLNEQKFEKLINDRLRDVEEKFYLLAVLLSYRDIVTAAYNLAERVEAGQFGDVRSRSYLDVVNTSVEELAIELPKRLIQDEILAVQERNLALAAKKKEMDNLIASQEKSIREAFARAVDASNTNTEIGILKSVATIFIKFQKAQTAANRNKLEKTFNLVEAKLGPEIGRSPAMSGVVTSVKDFFKVAKWYSGSINAKTQSEKMNQAREAIESLLAPGEIKSYDAHIRGGEFIRFVPSGESNLLDYGTNVEHGFTMIGRAEL